MGVRNASVTTEIDAPIERVWECVRDVERAPEWQNGLTSVVALEHDAEGRATLCDTATHAVVRTIHIQVRFSYEPPVRLRFEVTGGQVKGGHGWWSLEDLGGARTRATYALEGELGRVLDLIFHGPVEQAARALVINPRARELKALAESAPGVGGS
jgi:carbon monoxide dehydrogenase subunit G